MASKWQINQAVKHSQLVPPRRLIMLVLADVADPATAVIPDERTPSLRELADWTGLDKSTVTRHLDALDEDGWVIRNRPDRDIARRDQVRTKYRLAIPRGALCTTLEAEEDEPVVQSAPRRDAQDTTGRGADNTTPVVHPAPTPVVHSAPVPYTDEVENDKTSSSSPKAPKDEPVRLDVEKICNYLADKIAEDGTKRPTITAKWRTEARLLLDRDGKTVEQVMRCIDWCQADPFWRANILSMPKLRKQYETLRRHAQRPNGRASPRAELVEHNGLMLGERNQEAIERHQRIKALQAARDAGQTLSIEGRAA